MADSPFAQTGPSLYENGYNPIPIMPNSKLPGTFTDYSWRPAKGWNDYCTTRPSRLQINYWSTWPNASVGVACGLGLICIDIDFEPAMDPLIAMLPQSNVQKKGKKGISLFYRGNTDAIRSRNFRTPERVGLVDLLSEGKQTVLPPSIHPDTGEPYCWWTDDTLMDVRLDQLAELPDNIVERIGEVLKAYGYDPASERQTPLPALGASRAGPLSPAGNVWRRANDAALANLHAWVEKLALPKGRWHGSKYRAVAPWRSSGSGRPMAKRHPNLSFDPSGIQDFGTGETFTPINVVMKVMELGDGDEGKALEWLAPLVGVEIGDADAAALAERVVATAAQKEARQMETNDVGAANGSDDSELATLPPKPELSLANLTHPPGLIGRIVDWIEASAMYPSRELALGAAIGIVATIAGRGFKGLSGARTNFYMVSLALSGFGKDHAPSCINSLAMKAGLERFIGPSKFMSGSAVRNTVADRPSILCIQDEFGGILRQINGPKVSPHDEAIRTDLLGLYSRAKDFYAGAAYAALKEVRIFNPNLSILGLSTPSDFWTAVTSARGSDGFLPRFLLFNAQGTKPKRVKPVQSVEEPPAELVEGLQAIYRAVYGEGNLGGGLTTGEREMKARQVNCTDEASRLFDEFDARISTAQEQGNERRAPFLSRALEHAAKLALTVAVGDAPGEPVIELAHMQWATELAWVSTCAMIQEAESKIADNDRQRVYNQIYDLVRKAGPEGIQPSRLRDRLAGAVRKSEWNEIVEELSDTGRIRLYEVKPPGGGRTSKRYVAREFVHANDNNRASEKVVQGGS